MPAHLHDHPFKFYRIRSNEEPAQFCPHAGARLHFGSREADSLTLPTLPVGTLAAGDQVKVTYTPPSASASTVFLGTVERRVLRRTGGSEQAETVTVCGPWSKMARLVYRQGWLSMGADARSSRLVLNQTQGGAPQTLDSELFEIANHAAEACGYVADVNQISVSSQVLPSDECRDITVADALRRELRLFPKAVARFDYSDDQPKLVINRGQPASYAVADKTEREIEYDEHPITGVDLQIDRSGVIDGVSYLNITHQTAGAATADNPDCLYATLQVKGASANTVRQCFKSVTEDPSGSWQTADWWKQKHPRLANVATSALELSDVKCDGSASLPTNYPRISAATAGELEEAGLKCKVCKFTAKATIETTDDKEEEVYLTMHFLMTNATGTADDPKTYTWVAESSAESGESVPAGLAAAILAERCGRIRSEKMTVRLGDAFPAIGDTITDEGETLPLQSFDVDCADLTADLTFGAPEYLSPEDMAALLSNFRNKCTTWSSSLRKTGKAEDSGSNVEMGGIPPLSSTEFQPGTKAKTTVAPAASDPDAETSPSIVLDSSADTPCLSVSDGAKSITLDTKDIPDSPACEGKIAVHEFKYRDRGNVTHKLHGLFCSDIDLTDLGKLISSTEVKPSATPGGMNILKFNYTDGTSDTFIVANGLNGASGAPGADGDTPEITAERQGSHVYIYADGDLIATVEDGATPVITATKTGKVTTIYADGVPIATVSDGADGQGGGEELEPIEVVTGISYTTEPGEDGKLKLVANVTKKKIQAVLEDGNLTPTKVPVCDLVDVDVVVKETYDDTDTSSDRANKFVSEKKKVTVLGLQSSSPTEDVVFETTPHSSEGGYST